MIVSSVPIFIIDLLGSILMIVFAFPCLMLVMKLRRRDMDNVIWTYLLWVCLSLACFAVSRSAGHILKNLLFLSGHREMWAGIRPYSGSINTLTFIIVGATTLFFEQLWGIYQQISKDKQALQDAHVELLDLNQNLENRVAKRTQALTVSEQKYRRIFQGSRDMIMVVAKDGFIQDINPAGQKMLAISRLGDVVEHESFQSFLSGAHQWELLIDGLESDGFITNVELDMQTADGSIKRVLVSGSLAHGSADEGDSIHFLVKDIEQRRKIQEQMAQADKLASIGELSAGIAHEINNPLGIILGYTQLLMRNEDKDSERMADLRTIEKHVRNCKTIVEDLLNFARTSKPKKELVDIHGVIDDVVDFVLNHGEMDNVGLHKDYDRGLGLLYIDEKKIKQVLINLIMNAKHAVGNNGRIVLSTGRNNTAGKAIIQVEDDGHGIEKKDLSRIFDPFFTTKPTGEGTGLGLSVSYGIVKNHGGDVFADSQTGQGATFTIVLPLPHNVPNVTQKDNTMG